MIRLLEKLWSLSEFAAAQEHLQGGESPLAVTGLGGVNQALFAASAANAMNCPIVVVCEGDKEAERTAGDLAALLGEQQVLTLPGREWQFHPVSASHGWEHRRLGALHALLTAPKRAVVTTPRALMMRTLPCEVLQDASFTLAVGEQHDLKELTDKLVRAGYTRADAVEGPGQFALRGGILDVYSPEMPLPVRCEFFDDEIDAMGHFDVSSQRRTKNIESATVLPAAEVLFACGENKAEKLKKLGSRLEGKSETKKLGRTLLGDAEALDQGVIFGGRDRYMAAIYDEVTTAWDYLPRNAVVIFSESARVGEAVKNEIALWREDLKVLTESEVLASDFSELMLSETEFWEKSRAYAVCLLDALPTSRYAVAPKALLSAMTKQLPSYGGSFETARADLEQYRASHTAVMVLCGSEGRGRNLQRLLEEKSMPAALDVNLTHLPKGGQIRIAVGALSGGAEYPALGLAILSEGQLSAPNIRKVKRGAKVSAGEKLQSYTDLTPGDLVVHVHHGVGRFTGIVRMPVDGVEKDYIRIVYAGSDCLYVPATSLDLVSKYIGGGDDTEKMRLNKLGGTDWAKTKLRAKAAAKDLAKGLIALYAQRQKEPGFAFSPDSPWQQEFEEAFDYEETDDQLRCISEIKSDMESSRPMDRLLCGDVGYGKTEVALRAVMKCVLDGKQAAILVPTTVLAQQHYATAMSRFRNFPVNIEVLSRFRTPKQTADILKRLEAGKIDLLIGTHRLLQKSIKFRDLGLLIIDEEQRFGVSHKEKLKEMSRQVDVLTLSATPIPRTLNMALSGIRDMSAIEEPPRDRQPVQTYVLEHDWGMLAEAMRREIARGGQIFYLHNKVETIDRTALRISEMLGEDVRVVVGHGKMSEQQLSTVMREMVDGEADVLVCTTIIETGIDIPNVNTLVIEDADKMGLAQLHQIRGRIGRSHRRAFAYMTYRPGKILTEVASKRLGAIREYVEFGSGFKIAMRDLEIRGAGNLLGPEQSGYMMSVGYDLYLKLLEEAVTEEQGVKKPQRTECAADLTISANIPENYVPSAAQRMDLYRRIAAVRSAAEAGELVDELLDRYGEPPKSVMALMDVALLRRHAASVGITDISQKELKLRLKLGEGVEVAALAAVCAMPRYRERLRIASGEQPMMTLHLKKGENVLESALALVEDMKLSVIDSQNKGETT